MPSVSLGDLQFVVQLAQAEVSGGHIAHQRGHDGFAVLFRAQQIGARGFGRPAQPSPDVHFKGEQIERRLPQVRFCEGTNDAGSGSCAVARQPSGGQIPAGIRHCGNWLERVMPRLARASSTRATASRRS